MPRQCAPVRAAPRQFPQTPVKQRCVLVSPHILRRNREVLMFSGTGFHIQGGTFYNVGGDVNLQTHQHQHLQIESLGVPTTGSLLEDGGSEEPHGRRLAIEEHNGGIIPHPDSVHGPVGGTARAFARAGRNQRHSPASARYAPYDAAARHERGTKLTSNEVFPESSPSSSGQWGVPITRFIFTIIFYLTETLFIHPCTTPIPILSHLLAEEYTSPRKMFIISGENQG
ncbi:hypothetical protein B0H16DRAFT_1714665 [Mycena metata]|uniref:Uncharacterized protein n=1 Tax=Mycena metata TaxID=1033252 RepID=A0AAD7NS21_9AGAR|nr:hypothetical protein B0H16DRAFT_1714665 [Mycena metata]